MATVWLARDLKHDRRVALKVLRPELAQALGPERFLREIRLTAALDHPHILPLLDSGEAAGQLFYVMPFVDGESLRDRLDREPQLPLEDALQIAREVADALSYAHSHDVIHRDIKPENILLAAGHARVADFGIARAITAAGGEKLTETGIAVGTPAYMSPEQGGGAQQLDGRSDIYSLGCVLYETLAGHPPFTGITAQEILARHSMDAVPRLSAARRAVRGPIEDAVEKALEKAPADRFATPADLSAALVLDAAAYRKRERRLRRTRRALVAGTAVAAVAIGILGFTRYNAATAWKRVAVDVNAVAVMPFRITATDPGLATLDEGIVDLLYTVLTGDVGLRAIEPNPLLLAWRDQHDRDPTDPDVPLRLAAQFRAGSLLEGALVQAGSAVTLSAWLRRVPRGDVVARHSVSGRPDSIHVLARQLAIGLIGAQLSENAERLAGLEGRAPQAVAAYLAGTRAYRQGRYADAVRLLDQAIDVDSTFALAGLRLTEVGESQPGNYAVVWRGLRVVRPFRETLSRRDQAAFTALIVKNRLDTAATDVDILRAVRAWLDLAPDEPLAWRIYAREVRGAGPVVGIPNWEPEAQRALERAWALDSVTPAAVDGHLSAATLTEDITWLKRVGKQYLAAADTTGDHWAANQWAVALALGDSATVRKLRSRARAGDPRVVSTGNLWRLWMVKHTLGQTGDERLLHAQLRTQVLTAADSAALARFTMMTGLEQGRTTDVASILTGPLGSAYGPIGRWWYAIDFWLLYPGFNRAASMAFDSLSVLAGSRPDAHIPACYVQLYRAAQGDTAGARAAVQRLKPLFRASHQVGVCPALVESLLEARDRPRHQAPALDQLEALLRRGTSWEFPTTAAVVVTARLRRQRGEFARALSVARMRERGTVVYSLMRPALFKEEGDLAAITGDTTGAIDAYGRYLALRTVPDSALRAEVDSVRAALAGLLTATR